MRFRADVGRTNLVGFDRLNPQLQEQVIKNNVAPARRRGGKARTYAKGKRRAGRRAQPLGAPLARSSRRAPEGPPARALHRAV